MTAPYRLVLLGKDRAWLEEVEQRIADELEGLLGTTRAVVLEEVVPPPQDPALSPSQTVALFLADERSRDDEALAREIGAAREQLIPVLPVVRQEASVTQVLPEVLWPLNAVAWQRDGSQVCRAALRLLGLIEKDRRLFLSYRRQDTSALALQLREHLSRRAFDVFLDRFSVPPAADFQRRIDVELADKAFVLLLESASAVGSRWVQHEVAYALSHGISLLAVTLPDTPTGQQFPSVDPGFRLQLDRRDLEPSPDTTFGTADGADLVLLLSTLERVLDEIEIRYARQLRRRRIELLGSLLEWLSRADADPMTLEHEWAVAGQLRSGKVVFLVTPRAPKPADLQHLDTLRRSVDGGPVSGRLVFAAPVQDDEDRQLISWVIGDRPLATCAHAAVPGVLGLA